MLYEPQTKSKRPEKIKKKRAISLLSLLFVFLDSSGIATAETAN